MDDMKIFVPVTKIGAAQRLVYDIVNLEKPDVDGEVCNYASTKSLYRKWLRFFAARAKRMEICGKVIDDAKNPGSL
jgi:hypothetical protein